MMCYMGYKFGTGDTPREFQIMVWVVQTAYNVMVPLIQTYVIPLIIPALQAISQPMKILANVVLNTIVEQVRDSPHTATAAEKVLHSAQQNSEL